MTELPVVPAPQIPVTDSFHGVEVTEDYRWLEDAAAQETMAWTKAQQHRSQTYFGGSLGGRRCGPGSSSC